MLCAWLPFAFMIALKIIPNEYNKLGEKEKKVHLKMVAFKVEDKN